MAWPWNDIRLLNTVVFGDCVGHVGRLSKTNLFMLILYIRFETCWGCKIPFLLAEVSWGTLFQCLVTFEIWEVVRGVQWILCDRGFTEPLVGGFGRRVIFENTVSSWGRVYLALVGGL